MTDLEILALYANRDERAIRATAEKYGAKLRAMALRIVGDKGIAEECENDTYLEAWKRIPPADPQEYLFAFLAKIIRAQAIDRLREQTALKRNAELVELDDELSLCLPSTDDVADDVQAKLLGETVSRFLGTLPEKKQIVFVRRYFYLDPVSDIAARLGITESKVKTTLFRVRSELRQYLIKEGYTL